MGAVFILVCGLACSTTSAQEIPTQQQSASLQLFGLYSYVQPHYYPSSSNGISLGADLNLRSYYNLHPSLELRAVFAPGPDVTEKTYSIGPRIEADFSRLHPYIYALVGKGTITFAHPVIYPSGPYSHDDSMVFSGGIGANYMVTPRFGIRGDVMVQRWNLGGKTTTIIFYPHLYSVGVDYRFDFNQPLFHHHR